MVGPVVVTGVNGFVGHHLVRALRDSGRQVIGVGRDAEPGADLVPLLEEYRSVDLTTEPLDVLDVSGVVHLAGLSAVGPSFDDPQSYLTTNTSIVTNVCEPLMATRCAARVVVVSSGAVYDSSQALPISESGVTTPTSPYAVSKLAVEQQAAYYARRGLPAVVVRPFNHIGPGQSPGFLVPDLIRGLRAALTTGEAPSFGDLTSQRDYTDVRDVVAAYVALLAADRVTPGSVFNVCSGQPVAGTEILHRLARIAGLQIDDVGVDEARLRPSEPSVIAGSHERLTAATGWRPRRTLQSSLEDAWAASLQAS
ncbi:NAD-dependent epimerase/dehydratase family protein [Nocardioides zeae]